MANEEVEVEDTAPLLFVGLTILVMALYTIGALSGWEDPFSKLLAQFRKETWKVKRNGGLSGYKPPTGYFKTEESALAHIQEKLPTSAVGTQVLHFKMFRRKLPFIWEHMGCYGRDSDYGTDDGKELMYPKDRIMLICEHVKEQCDLQNNHEPFLMRASYHRLYCGDSCAHNAFHK